MKKILGYIIITISLVILFFLVFSLILIFTNLISYDFGVEFGISEIIRIFLFLLATCLLLFLGLKLIRKNKEKSNIEDIGSELE